MRKLALIFQLAWYYLTGIGPWIVVGQYYDDDGRLCRFRTGSLSNPHSPGLRTYRMSFDNKDDADAYADSRNDQAITDPLGTVYYVWHELEFNNFALRRK